MRGNWASRWRPSEFRKNPGRTGPCPPDSGFTRNRLRPFTAGGHEFLIECWKAQKLNLDNLLHVAGGERDSRHHVANEAFDFGASLDQRLLWRIQPALDGVEPVVVFTDHGDGHFFSIPVRPISGHSSVTYDALIVAAFDDTATRVQFLERLKVPREKLVLLRAAANEGSPA